MGVVGQLSERRQLASVYRNSPTFWQLVVARGFRASFSLAGSSPECRVLEKRIQLKRRCVGLRAADTAPSALITYSDFKTRRRSGRRFRRG